MIAIRVVFLLGVLLAYAHTLNVHAFDLESHRRLSEKAVIASNIDAYLIQHLSFPLGIAEQLSDGVETRRVIDWAGEGSIREDDGTRPAKPFS
jgi:hypothetical protein